MKLENKKNILIGNSFFFKIPPSYYDSIEFKISNLRACIRLKYHDEYWIENKTGNYMPTEDGSTKNEYYEKIEKEIVKLFDTKYSRLSASKPFSSPISEFVRKTTTGDLHFISSYVWKTNGLVNRIVTLDVDKDIWLESSNIDFQASPPTVSEDKKRFRLAKCKIEIDYYLYKDYWSLLEESKSLFDKFEKGNELIKKKTEEHNDNL